MMRVAAAQWGSGLDRINSTRTTESKQHHSTLEPFHSVEKLTSCSRQGDEEATQNSIRVHLHCHLKALQSQVLAETHSGRRSFVLPRGRIALGSLALPSAYSSKLQGKRHAPSVPLQEVLQAAPLRPALTPVPTRRYHSRDGMTTSASMQTEPHQETAGDSKLQSSVAAHSSCAACQWQQV